MRVRDFGRTTRGEPIQAIALEGGGLMAEVLTWGAVVRTLKRADLDFPFVLGFDSLEHYEQYSPYFGCIAGRVANRIGRGHLGLGGKTYQLDLNERGITHLHGGSLGFGVRPWMLSDAGRDHVSLQFVSADGDMGYPERLAATCTYRLVEPGTLRIELGAACEGKSVVNLAHHSYFNLDGTADLASHKLMVNADRVTAVDADLIPSGRLLDVEGTIYDMRTARALMPSGHAAPGYDINFCLSEETRMLGAAAARLGSSMTGVSLEVWTTEPGLQVYDGHGLDIAVPGLGGRRYGPRAGICLEAQRWPDAPNHPGFPSIEISPGVPYAQITEYRFSQV